MPGDTRLSKPRPSMVSAKVPCTSSQARTQREQTMHLRRVVGEIGVGFVAGDVVDVQRAVAWRDVVAAVGSRSGLRVRPTGLHDLVELASPFGAQARGNRSDGRRRRAPSRPCGCGRAARSASCTTMPSATGVVQEAGVPPRPSISTRQTRQEPKAFSMSVAQSFGISIPASIAARMIEVPAGTVTACAVDGQRHRLLGFASAACRSRLLDQRLDVDHGVHGSRSYSAASATGDGRKSSGKCVSALITGYGVKPPSAQSDPNFIVSQSSSTSARFASRVLAGDDAVDHLDAAHRADPAGRALAAGFDGAELEGEAGLRRHVDGVVEHDDAAMADQPVGGGEGLVVERRVEQRGREIGAERPADLHGAHRPAGRACRRRCRSTSSPSVTPKAVSNSPPCLMLPASWIGIVPRERPMP